MFNEGKNSKTLLTVMICMVYGGLFFSMNISNILLGVFLIFCLLQVRYRNLKETLAKSIVLWLFAALFLSQVIGLIYSENIKNGLFVIEKKISFVLMPVLLLTVLHRIELDSKSICRWIGLITLASTFILFFIAFVKYFFFNDDQAFFYERITSIHYVYYAIYLAVGSLFLIESYIDDWIQSASGRIKLSILIIYSFSALVMAGSKTGIASFCAGCLYLLFKRLPKKLFIASLIIFITSGIVLFYFNDTIRGRFTEMNQSMTFLLENDFRGVNVYVTDLTMRLIFWKISITQLWRDNIVLFGAGTGDAQDYLNMVYKLPQYQFESYTNWDTHNQWVFTFIQLGIVGLVIMIIPFAYYTFKSIRYNDFKFTCFLIVIVAFSLTESVLESNKGIVFFTLIFTILASDCEKKRVLTSVQN